MTPRGNSPDIHGLCDQHTACCASDLQHATSIRATSQESATPSQPGLRTTATAPRPRRPAASRITTRTPPPPPAAPPALARLAGAPVDGRLRRMEKGRSESFHEAHAGAWYVSCGSANVASQQILHPKFVVASQKLSPQPPTFTLRLHPRLYPTAENGPEIRRATPSSRVPWGAEPLPPPGLRRLPDPLTDALLRRTGPHGAAPRGARPLALPLPSNKQNPSIVLACN